MSQFVHAPTRAFVAGAAIDQYLRVILTTGKLAVAGSGDLAVGTLEAASFADGDNRAVRLRTAEGTQKMVASGAITADNPVYAAAGGKIASSGSVLEGYALEAATADGDIIEVMPLQGGATASSVGGTTAAAFLVDNDSTTPKIELLANASGTGNYKQSLTPASTLTANRVATFQDTNDTLVYLGTTDTLTNKTLTAPAINNAAIVYKTATVAVGGTALANANAVAEGFTLVTGADNTAAVKLPPNVAGIRCEIKSSTSGKVLIVFPPAGGKINGASTNAAYNHANLATRTYYCYNATDWFAAPETIT